MLVVSIDGLAPRHVTRAVMPALTTLALEGASCFTARTVAPPWTVPAHASMLRGVDPATHGLSDNTPAPLRTSAPSFLKAARDAGRSTAMFVSWLPLDAVIERDAATQRFVIDSGYDPDDDRRMVDAAIAAVADGGHDLTFAYLVRPDLAGHTRGWDSAEYVDAAGRADTDLARLLDAVGDGASVLVTTDHGGVGTDHADQVPDVMETFVVVRAPGAGRSRVGLGGGLAARRGPDRRRPVRDRSRPPLGGVVAAGSGAPARRCGDGPAGRRSRSVVPRAGDHA